MRTCFWGVRGSIPTPVTPEEIERKIILALQGAHGLDLSDAAAVQAYVRSLAVPARGCWGGNTTCIELRTAADDVLIIDGGSGVRGLGEAMMEGRFGRGEGHGVLLFTHTHWDHIQGLPFFKPLYVQGNRFDLYARHGDLRERLRAQHDPRFFPVSMDAMRATQTYHTLGDAATLFDGRVTLHSLALDHPGVAYAYRVEADGASFIMASDGEYRELGGDYWQRYVDFYRGADVLVFDAQYTQREALVEKQNWGHSSAMIGIDLAVQAGVRKLVLVHHEPSYDDDHIKRVFDNALRWLDQFSPLERPEVVVAHEGLTLELGRTEPPVPPAGSNHHESTGDATGDATGDGAGGATASAALMSTPSPVGKPPRRP